MKPARVAAVHRLAGQAGGKKTKYTTGEDVQQPRSEDGIYLEHWATWISSCSLVDQSHILNRKT